MENRHPLAAWMELHPEINQAQLAAECQCSQSHISLVLQGKRGVSIKLAQRLSRVTGGKVSVEDFIQEEETAQ